jgi:putative ABC transport system permease protein
MVLDLTHLLRSLRRSPTSAAAAVFILALTLGAGTTIAAIVDAVLLTPPAIADPDMVVTLGETPIATRGAPRMISYPTFEAWRERAGSLATLAAFDGTVLTLTGLGAAERIGATDVDPQFLPLLGVTPRLGRSFQPHDVGQAVAIVSHEFWRARLGSDRGVVGRTIVLNGRAHEVIGVLPEGFRFALTDEPIWRPLPLTAAQAARTTFRMRALARLAPGTTPVSLAAALDQVSGRAAPPSRAIVTPVATAIGRGSRGTFGLLAAAAAIATVMAFFNLTGLLVVRTMDRAQELAVRVAIGARPSAVVSGLMIEAETLVVIGTSVGVLLAAWLTPAAARLVQQQFGPIMNRDIEVSWRVVAVVALVAAVCAALAASVPALLAARRAAAESLRRGRTRSPRELALRRFLIAGEVALAFVLLVSMALLAESLGSALQRHPGFRADGVMTFGISLPAARYAGNREEAAFYATVKHALDERLGAGTTAVVDELPLTGDGGRTLVGATPADAHAEAVTRVAGPSYFDVMGIPIVAGRGFDDRDDASAPRRVVVSARLAAKVFGTAPAIGQTLYLAGPRQRFDVVGVVGDVMHRSVDEAPLETIYLPVAQGPSRTSRIVVRSQRLTDVAGIARDEVARLDRDLPVYAVLPMTDVVAASAGMPARRVLTSTFTAFALLALVLSGVGLFALVAHDVAARRSELALRVALGAHPTRLLTATLRQGTTIIGTGVTVGLALSVWSGQILTTLAPATERFDLATTLAAAAVLLILGLAAVLPAARRAARTDPLAALRAE